MKYNYCNNCEKETEIEVKECIDIYSGVTIDDLTYLEDHCKECDNLIGGYN